MGLSASEINQLNRIEREMARKGFTLGNLLNTQIAALEANTAFNNEAAAVDPGDAGSLSATAKLEEIVSVGAESRVLPAPAAGFTGLKIIRFKTDGGDVTIAGTNVLGDEAQTFTMAAVGDTIALIGNGGVKWILIVGTLVAA